MEQRIEKYLKLPYTIELIKEPDDDYSGWVARVVEFPGCITQADTIEELPEMIEDAMRGWISVALEDGDEVPLPRLSKEYSGKFVTRVPKTLHRCLVEEAESEGVSLNAYINMVLASRFTQRQPQKSFSVLNTVSRNTKQDDKNTKENSGIDKDCLYDEVNINHPQIIEEVFSKKLGEMKRLIDNDDLSQALSRINEIEKRLSSLKEDDAILDTLLQMITLLKSQVEVNHGTQIGQVSKSLIDKKISKQVYGVDKNNILLKAKKL